MSREWFTFECTVLLQTEKAVQIELDGEEIWIPKSQIEDAGDLPLRGGAEITMTAWIAKQKGLI